MFKLGHTTANAAFAWGGFKSSAEHIVDLTVTLVHNLQTRLLFCGNMGMSWFGPKVF